MSALVPPISKVIRFFIFFFDASHKPAFAPATSPDSKVSSGCLIIISGVASPPLEVIILNSAFWQIFFKLSDKLSIYCVTFGPMKAATAPVVKRSNSRNCGETLDEVVTKALGICSLTSSKTRFSCALFR